MTLPLLLSARLDLLLQLLTVTTFRCGPVNGSLLARDRLQRAEDPLRYGPVNGSLLARDRLQRAEDPLRCRPVNGSLLARDRLQRAEDPLLSTALC